MTMYDSPIDKILPQLMGGSRQAFSGTDPDWTALATMFGYRPNPFPTVGTQGQDEQRFLQTLKSIMDQQMGGYGDTLSNISPGNPIAAMPNSMYNYMAGASPLFNSPAAMAVAPTGTQGFFSQGYKQGALPSTNSPMIQQYLSNLQGGTPPSNVGASTAAVNSITNPAGASPIQQLSGGNTPQQTPPANGGGNAAAAAAAQTTGGQDIRDALMNGAAGAGGDAAAPSVGNVSRPGVSYDRKEGIGRPGSTPSMNADQYTNMASTEFYNKLGQSIAQILAMMGGGNSPMGNWQNFLQGR